MITFEVLDQGFENYGVLFGKLGKKLLKSMKTVTRRNTFGSMALREGLLISCIQIHRNIWPRWTCSNWSPFKAWRYPVPPDVPLCGTRVVFYYLPKLWSNLIQSSVTLVRFSKVRPKMTRKMRTIIEILTPHAQHYDNFLQNFWAYCSRHDRVCGKVSFYGEHFFTWL